MSRKRHSAEEDINKLREADVELGKGSTVAAGFFAVLDHTVVPSRTRKTLYPITTNHAAAESATGSHRFCAMFKITGYEMGYLNPQHEGYFKAITPGT